MKKHARAKGRFGTVPFPEVAGNDPRQAALELVSLLGGAALDRILHQMTRRSMAGDAAGAVHYERIYDEAIRLVTLEADAVSDPSELLDPAVN